MAPKAPEPAGPTALPSTTDFNALYNRISLAAAKQNSFLTSMRAKYPSLSTSTSSKPSAPKTSSFTALRPESNETAPAKTKAQLRAAEEDAADTLRFDAPNAGLGYVPSKAEAHADTATQDLSRRILGKRAREIKGRAAGAGAKSRAAVDDESDEDEGRSGLGRRKRTRALPKQEEEEEADADAVVATSDEAAPAPNPAPEAVPEEVTPIAPTPESIGPEAPKSKKKKNKKKKKSQE